MYKLLYLPTAKQDIEHIFQYIAITLQNKTAAQNLAVKIKKSIDNLQDFPFAYSVYQAAGLLQKEYRKIVVQSYLIFYWVDEATKTVTISRVIYAKRNYKHLLKIPDEDTQ